MGERGALGPGALLPGDGAEGGGTDCVVGVAGERAVLVPGAVGDPRNQVQEGGGDDGRVDVDAREVQRASAGRLVEFGARRRASAGPAGGVPAVTEEDPVGGAGGGEVPYEGERGVQGGGVGQVEAGEREARRGGVHVCVGERRGDQCAFEVHDLVDPVREGVGRALRADPGDLPAFDDHRGGEGIGGTVDFSTAQQHGVRRGGALTHGEQSRPCRDPLRAGGRQIRGGRAS